MQGIPQGQNPQGGSQKPSLSWQSPNQPNKPVQSAPSTAKPVQVAPRTNQKIGQEKSNTATYVGIFVAGLVVGVLLGWGIAATRSGTNSSATTTPQGADASGSSLNNSSGAGDVVVDSPQNAGLSVAVSKANVTKPTWVAVYDDNSGVPGLALGATLFYPASMGGATSGTINLLRATVAGKDYLVGERIDDGNHVLSFQKDTPVLDTSGKPILTVLTAK